MNFISKCILAGCISFLMASAWAGGSLPDPATSYYDSKAPYYFQNAYIEMGTGYTYTDWAGFAANGIGAYTTVTSNSRGGAIFNAAVGYQYIKYFTTEVNYFYLPLTKGTNASGDLKAKNWLVDLVGKLYYPVLYRFYIFAKVGVAYHQVTYEGAGGVSVVSEARVWTPVYGAGVQYDFPKNFYSTVQWLRVPEYTNTSTVGRRLPSSDVYYFTVGYRFII